MRRFKDVCGANIFIIPKNQRAFSWNRKNVEDVFNDLILAGTDAHYMGPIIVSRTDRPDFQDDDYSNISEFYLEDGQQRLTSLMLIVKAMLDRLNQVAPDDTATIINLRQILFYKSGHQMLRLSNENPDLNQFFQYLLTGSPAPPAVRTPPMRALENALNYATAKVATFDHRNLKKWLNKFSNQAKFIWVDLKTEGINRYLAFDAINSRGLPLSEFDKIKNFCILISEVQGLDVQPEKRWYEAISHLEAFNVGTRAQEESFIAELFSIFHSEPVGKDSTHESFVNKYRDLLENDKPVLSAQVQEFIDLWPVYAEAFAFISGGNQHNLFSGNNCTKAAYEWLTKINNMDFLAITRPLAAASLLQFGNKSVEEVFRACEIYSFRMHSIMRYRIDKNKRGLIELSHRILRQTKSCDYVLMQICDWLGTDASLHLSIQKLGDGTQKYPYDSSVPGGGWAQLYYFLYEYELENSPTLTQSLPWAKEKEAKKASIEHILPQSHRDGAFWERAWPEVVQAEKFKHRLGNLVLTERNQQLGRKSIKEKVYGTGKPGTHFFTKNNATNSEKKIEKYSRKGSDWKVENILSRERDMLEFAANRWSIPCCVDNGKIDLPEEFQVIEKPYIVVEYDQCIESRDTEAVDEPGEIDSESEGG